MSKTQQTIKSKTPSQLFSMKKVYNKYVVASLLYSFSLILLILAASLGWQVFAHDDGKISGNIVMGVICTVLSILFFVYTFFLQRKKCVAPMSQELYIAMLSTAAIPFVGTIIAIIWRCDEKRIYNASELLKNPNFKPNSFMPATLTILFVLIIFVIIISWIYYVATGGVTYTYKNKNNEEITEKCLVPGIFDLFLNIIKGFTGYYSNTKVDYWTTTSKGEIIVTPGMDKYQHPWKSGTASIAIFLMSMAGMMQLLSDSKALEAGMGRLLAKMKGKEIYLVPLLTFVLSICGTVFGMCEQTMPLFVVVVPLLCAAGFDAMTGALVIIFGAGIGVTGSLINPSMISVAVDSANSSLKDPEKITITTGIAWRAIIYLLLAITCCVVVTIYAKRVKANPRKSLVYMSDEEFKQKWSFDHASLPEFNRKRKISLSIFAITFLLLIIGFVSWEKIIPGFTGMTWLNEQLLRYFPFLCNTAPIGEWSMVEGAFLFFLGGFAIGLVNWQGEKHFIKLFVGGCASFVGVAFTCTIARGLSITLTESGLHKAIISGAEGPLSHLPAPVFIIIVFLLLAILSVFIPSTSGLGSASMPILAPLASSVHLTPSSVITAFSHAEGFVNMFAPTTMVLPQLEASKIDNYKLFLKSSWWILLSFLLVIIITLTIGASCLPSTWF